jgi:hypothetical protein
MKKFITAIVALLYITSSTGADVYTHYCMGKVADWGIGHNNSKTCAKCGMEKSDAKDNGCCKDEHKFFKNDSAQKITEPNLQYFHLFTAVLPATFGQPAIIGIPSVSELFPFSHAPPRMNGIAVYIRNCTFLI